MPVALVGAGGVGRMHIERLARHPSVALCAVADPTEAGRAAGAAAGVPVFADHRALLAQVRPAAAIVATPNTTHVAIALDCLDAGVPVLVEKPIADEPADAQRLVQHAAQCGLPVLVGHQRRYNPVVRQAHALVASGALGRPVSATVMATWLKPDAYFDTAWRRQPGAGPVLINLIHDIDLLRHLCGEVVAVQAMASNARRGFEVEDTAAAVLRMANGALATLVVSDCAVSPWNYDLAAGEAAHYVQQAVDSLYLTGTDASLALPHGGLWRHAGARGWHEPLTQQRCPPHAADPYTAQLTHLRAVVEGREPPLCSAEEGLRTLRATRAVLQAAATGTTVHLDEGLT
jgi:predicted dehydrogenase